MNEKNTDPEKVYAVGVLFKQDHHELMVGCCEAGIVGAMNRWIPGKIEVQRVERITETICAKKPDVQAKEVQAAILSSIDKAVSQHRSRIWI